MLFSSTLPCHFPLESSKSIDNIRSRFRRTRKRGEGKKGRRENLSLLKKFEFCSQNSHITNRTRVCAVLCANLKMFCSQKRTERTNRTHSHNANRTTMRTSQEEIALKRCWLARNWDWLFVLVINIGCSLSYLPLLDFIF